MDSSNTYLKRGAGKAKGTIKKDAFYAFYKNNAKQPLLDKKEYNAFLKELLVNFSEAIVELGLELKIPKVGKLRIKSNPLHFFKKDGQRAKSLRPDWERTWEYWHKKYEGLTRQEITEIKNKPIIFHENDHTQNEFYEHYWDKITTILKFKSFYNFKASRQYSRLIAKVVKDPNRKIFYYG